MLESEFSAELVKLREISGLTQRQLASRVGTSSSSLCRWESGQTAPRRDYAEQLDSVLEAKGTLLRLWKSQTSGSALPEWMRDVVQLEEESRLIEWISPVLVPGVLQSPGYARIVFEEGQPLATSAEISRLVSLRCARYELLRKRNDPQVTAVFPVTALTGFPKEVRREQAAHLLTLMASRRLRLQLVPEGSLIVGVASPLILFRLRDGSRAASSDTNTGNVIHDENAGLDRLSELAKGAFANALPTSQSQTVLEELL